MLYVDIAKLSSLKDIQKQLVEALNGKFYEIENKAFAKNRKLKVYESKNDKEAIDKVRNELIAMFEQLKTFNNSRYDFIYFSAEMKVLTTLPLTLLYYLNLYFSSMQLL